MVEPTEEDLEAGHTSSSLPHTMSEERIVMTAFRVISGPQEDNRLENKYEVSVL